MESSSEALSIVATIVSLAHSLDLKVIAEGVETEGQIQLLRRLKCNEIQGYVITPPFLQMSLWHGGDGPHRELELQRDELI
jgi:EAL domain-containing protein (putative c-di-GMP-specific phosphodiesterase class I)